MTTVGTGMQPRPVTPAPRDIAAGFRDAQANRVAVQWGLADALAVGTKHFTELADAVGAHAPTLYWLLRALVALGVVSEAESGVFSLPESGATLRTGVPGSARDFVLFLTADWYWRAWQELLYAVQTGESAFERANGMPSFEYWKRNPEAGAVRDAAFAAMTGSIAPAIATAYDFSRFATVVDVGGSRGALLTAILRAHPGVKGNLFDLPRVVAEAGPVSQAEGVSDRCRVVGGDFFVSVPSGGDACVLKQVIRDWDDARAVAILTRCREALGSGGTVLLVETVLPERLHQSLTSHWAAMVDLMMLVATPGGRERTAEQFRALLAAAGFALTGIMPVSPQFSIVEAVAG